MTVRVVPAQENLHMFDVSVFSSWVGAQSLGTTPKPSYTGDEVCNNFEVTVSIVCFHPQHKPTAAVNPTIYSNTTQLQHVILVDVPQGVWTSGWSTGDVGDLRHFTPSGLIALISSCIFSWETTYPLWIARRCNHRYTWIRPLVGISNCRKLATCWMSVCFFLLNKFSFLRCSVCVLIIIPCLSCE